MSANQQTRRRPQASAGARGARKSRGHGAKPEVVRERAVVALLSAKTIGAAARRCGVHERTLRRWMREDEEFQGELAEARQSIFQASMNRVQALTAQAVDTLATLMGKGMPPTVRLGAARTVAEFGIHQHEAETILKRLSEVEAAHRQQPRR